MSPYVAFSDLVERGLCCQWRNLCGDTIEISECVDSVVFTQKDTGSKWSYSFALRYQGRWVQVSRSIEPVEYDIFGSQRSPNNIASDLVQGLIADMEESLRGEI